MTLSRSFSLAGPAILALPVFLAGCAGGGHSHLPDLTEAIFYTSRVSGDRDIYAWDPDTLSSVDLTNSSSDDFNPFAAPDGHIYFASDRDGGTPHIFMMNDDGSNVVQLTSGAGVDLLPTIDQFGTVYFTRGDHGLQNIWRRATDGTLTQVTTSGGYDPCTTNQGGALKILFCSDRTGNSELYVCDPDGGNERQITHSADLNEYVPAVDPGDGTILVAVQEASGAQGIDYCDYSSGIEAVAVPSDGQFKDWPCFSGGQIVYSVRPAEGVGGITLAYLSEDNNGNPVDHAIDGLIGDATDPTSFN